jgi:DNA-binding transcriptional LysR family regulator
MTKPTAGPTASGAAAWLRRIRYRHLEVLLAISRHGSLTAAAAALDMTQPATSQWRPTSSRPRAPVRARQAPAITPLRRRCWPDAERVFADAQRVVDELDAIRSGGTGQVRLGMMQVAARLAWCRRWPWRCARPRPASA